MSKGETIAYAIKKECSSWNLVEWCKNWDITIDEFNAFLRFGKEAFDAKMEVEHDER